MYALLGIYQLLFFFFILLNDSLMLVFENNANNGIKYTVDRFNSLI